MATVHGLREAFTFDDVLLKPGPSDVLPSDVDIRSYLTRAIEFGWAIGSCQMRAKVPCVSFGGPAQLQSMEPAHIADPLRSSSPGLARGSTSFFVDGRAKPRP